ncbi:MAG TPA: cytochrome c3 family protein [Polyangia bacterium]|nr:cytochrome c3 family protein [Polyangia bacterium]
MKTSAFVVGIVVGAAGVAGALAGLASAAPSASRDAGADGPRPVPSLVLPAAPKVADLPPSPLIFPGQRIPLRFDHAQHLKLGARCETCHVSAATSTTAADVLIPAEAACRACHEIDRAAPTKAVPAGSPAARCDACHIGDDGRGWLPRGATFATPDRVDVPRPNLKFNHAVHAARGIGCELCHANVSMKGLATRDDLPKMSLCLSCHDGKRAIARCPACHVTEPDGRLKTTLATAATAAAGGTGKLEPSGVLRGIDAHGPTFARDHAQAGREESYCLQCHKRSECVDCHGGTVRPFDIHPSDYVSLHAVDARRNVPDCSTCHRAQTFCVGCHQRTGVSADPEGGARGVQPNNPFGTGTQLKRFHPPGWVNEGGGGSSAHSDQARRNIRSCASCHREESCLACHSTDPTRGMNVSPHGPGFGGTARCRALSQKNRRACLKCHALGAAEIDCEMP